MRSFRLFNHQAIAAALLVSAACTRPHTADTPPEEEATGRVLVLPGVTNICFQLAAFARAVRDAHPGFDVEIRSWGPALCSLHNLAAHERNLQTAAGLAAELSAYRRDHPSAPLYVVGYSGGGGIAVLAAAALPPGTTIDRLILIAPAIAFDYPIVQEALPSVREFAVNYASDRDLQVGWGTRWFGTVDRKHSVSAGFCGFSDQHDKLLQWQWAPPAAKAGHFGNHLSYLAPRWQHAYLLPALDPQCSAAAMQRILAADPAGPIADSTAPPGPREQVP